ELEKAKLKKEQEDELKKLLEEANKLKTVEKKEETGVGKKFYSGERQQSGLNPNISVSGDFFGAISSSKSKFISQPSDVSYGNNRFELRELQIELVSPLDPFTRGKSFISMTKDEISIEEAYMEWLNLPANLNLKIGIFYTEFGTLNRYHDHALPQFDRPRVLVNMFSNKGLGGWGMAGNFLLPPLLWADASSFDISLINGGDDHSFTSEGKFNLLSVGQFKNYYDITDATYFEWSLSGAAGKNDASEKLWSYVGDLAFTVKWVPIGRSKYRTIDWKTELLFNYRETPTGHIQSKGFFTSLQNKLNARYWFSGRIGYSELPWDNNQHEWDFTTCLDFWQSEFVFYRFQYQYSLRDFTSYLDYAGPFPDDHTFLFHACWAMGPHKHEAY
ncbi:MAG: hypothetical protein MUC94_09620, partial [bacterium]|nr:hypothetical protein [bacterium]